MSGTTAPLRPPLLVLLQLAAIASLAHALPSPQLDSDKANVVVGLDVEQDSLLPTPSDMLIREMNRHNAAFNYHYTLWNVTNLNAESCRQAAEQLHSETGRGQGAEEDSCTPTYSCDFDRFRFPHWLVFTSCSLGSCDPARRSARCFVHEEDILMLRYVERSRSTRDASTAPEGSVSADNVAVTATAANSRAASEKHSAGEWKPWIFQVPSECNCLV